MAVIAIMGIFASAAIPSAVGYMRRARFAQNEENAKAVFLTAESVLTYYRTSGQWEGIRGQIEKECDTGGVSANVIAPPKSAVTSDFLGALNESGGAAGKMEPRVKTLLFPGADSGGDVSGGTVAARLRTDMLARVTDGSGLKDGAIAIEIDTESGRVYSAFYASSDKRLAYGTGDASEVNGTGDQPTLYIFGKNRSFESRRESLIGHYDATDAVEIADLKKSYISVMSCALVNGEMLTVDITSDSRENNADANFKIEIFAANDETPLYELTVAPGSIGWSTDSIPVKKICEPASVMDTSINFPIYREGANISIVLDAISSPALMEAGSGNDFSITRFPGASPSDTNVPFNQGGWYDKPIKCRVTPISIVSDKSGGSVKWTNASEVMTGDGYSEEGGVPTYRVGNFRHFYNARHIMGKAAAAGKKVAFHVVDSLNWDNARMFVKAEAGGVNPAPVKGEEASFPVFDTLSNASFVGEGDGIRIMNLKIDNASFKSSFSDTYAGLFCDVKNVTNADGSSIDSVNKISFDNAVMKIDCAAAPFSGASADLQGIGFLCGKNDGTISNVTVNDMSVTLANVYSAASRVITDFSFGGLAGVNTVQGKIDDCTASGFAVIENIDLSNAAVSKTGNAGGIAGTNLGTITGTNIGTSFGDRSGMHFKAESGAGVCALCTSNAVTDDALHFNETDFSSDDNRDNRKMQHAVDAVGGMNQPIMQYWSKVAASPESPYVTARQVSIIKIGTGNAGGIAGFNSGTGIINGASAALCNNYGLIYAKQGNVGGIAGKSDGTSIANATNYGTAAVGDGNGTVQCNAGGVIGCVANTSATGCFNYGLVQAVGSDTVNAAAGGMIGYLASGSTSSGSSENHGTVLAYGKAAKAGGWLGSNVSDFSTSDPFANTASGFVYASGGEACAGGVFGYAESVTMSNTSTVGGKIEANGNGCSAGGIIGAMSDGEMDATVSGANVTAGADGYAGGFVGYADGGSVKGTMDGGTVTVGANGYAGGFAGGVSGLGNVDANIISYATVKAGSGSYAGGIVGKAEGDCVIKFVSSSTEVNLEGEGTLATAIGYGDTFTINEGTMFIESRDKRFIGDQLTSGGGGDVRYPAYYTDEGDGPYLYYIRSGYIERWQTSTSDIGIQKKYVLDMRSEDNSKKCTDVLCDAGYTTVTVVGVRINDGYNSYGEHDTSEIGRQYIWSVGCDHKIMGSVE